MKQTLEERIMKMIDKIWMYNAKEHKLLSFKIEENDLILVTDRCWIRIPLSLANKKLDEFLPVEVNDKNVALVSLPKETRTTLINLIQDNITKIKNDPEYIKQAKEINSQVRTILDIVKTELQIHKATNNR